MMQMVSLSAKICLTYENAENNTHNNFYAEMSMSHKVLAISWLSCCDILRWKLL